MTTEALNKSDLIERISLKNPHLAEPLVEEAVANLKTATTGQDNGPKTIGDLIKAQMGN